MVVRYDAYAPHIFEHGAYIAASGGLASVVVAIAMSVWRAREAKDAQTFGSARWATEREVRAAGLLGLDGTVLGQLGRAYVRHDGPEHVLCFAPTRSGRLEAALARRLDRMTHAIERLERHGTIGNEALALFVRFWLTSVPPLPDSAQPAAQAKGREHYEGFVEALGRRLAKGKSLADEIAREIEPDGSSVDG